VVNRLVLLLGGVLFARLAWRLRPQPAGAEHQPVGPPRWLRGWAYTACAVPILGFTVPHALWMAGVPFGINPAMVDEVGRNLSLSTGLALFAGPMIGGLLSLGLTHRWGRVLPAFVPVLGGRDDPGCSRSSRPR